MLNLEGGLDAYADVDDTEKQPPVVAPYRPVEASRCPFMVRSGVETCIFQAH